jgi:hypothetical protein
MRTTLLVCLVLVTLSRPALGQAPRLDGAYGFTLAAAMGTAGPGMDVAAGGVLRAGRLFLRGDLLVSAVTVVDARYEWMVDHRRCVDHDTDFLVRDDFCADVAVRGGASGEVAYAFPAPEGTPYLGAGVRLLSPFRQAVPYVAAGFVNTHVASRLGYQARVGAGPDVLFFALGLTFSR